MNKDMERTDYWKKRVLDRLTSVIGQNALDFKEMWKNINHVPLETKDIQIAFEKIDAAYQEFSRAVANATKKVEGESKPFQESMKVQENVQVAISPVEEAKAE